MRTPTWLLLICMAGALALGGCGTARQGSGSGAGKTAQPAARMTTPAPGGAPSSARTTSLPPGLANPAAVYCREQGHTSQIRTAADGSLSGVCIFPDGSECDEWAYYRSECRPAGGAGAQPPASGIRGANTAGAARTASAAGSTPSPLPAAGTATGSASAGSGPAPGTGASIDALFAPWDRPGSPGCALAVEQDGRMVYGRGYGMASLEHGVPITVGTVFNAGSIGKQFTAMAAALLDQDGVLGLDQDIRRYVPELPDYGTPITLRRLLSHTSGLRDDRTLALMAGWRDDDSLTQADLLGLITRQKGLNSPTGQEYVYSNSNFTLLALAVQRSSGQTLPEVAAGRIFRPLGMVFTQFMDDPLAVTAGKAAAYARSGAGYRQSLPMAAVAGPTNLYTTAADLGLWAHNFVSGQVGGTGLVRAMTEPAALSDGTTVNYNYGLSRRTLPGLGLAVGHNGYDGGFKSRLLVLPDRRMSVAVLCNLESIDPDPLAEGAARLYLGLAVEAAATPSPAPTAGAEPVISLPAAELARRAGAYMDLSTTRLVRLLVDRDRLKVAGAPGTELVPVEANRFRLIANGQATAGEARFTALAAGGAGAASSAGAASLAGAYSLRITQAGTLNGSYQPYPGLPEGGRGYAGSFFSAELGAWYTLSVADGILILDSRRFVHVPLLPAGGGQFVMAEALPRITISTTVDAGGSLAAFTLSLDRARNVRFERGASPAGGNSFTLPNP